MTGDIVTGSLDCISVWSINGQLLAQHALNSPCCSVTFSCGPEWKKENVIVSGHEDGSICLWSISEFVVGSAGEHQQSSSPRPHGDKRQCDSLILRARKDGHSSAVTCLQISADQRRLFSGDRAGVVLVWSAEIEELTSHWIPDGAVDKCSRCGKRFSLVERKHHCRNCGRVVCAACSNHMMILPHLNNSKPLRVCDDCQEFLAFQQKQEFG